MQKNERQKLILDVIASRDISRQDELAHLLHESGVEVTQASVSRDLFDLGIVKVDGKYVRAEISDPRSNPFGISALDPCGENLLVIKCASGLASAAAVRIDAEQLNEIAGTIAGDDTIFVAVPDVSRQKAAMKKLRALFAE